SRKSHSGRSTLIRALLIVIASASAWAQIGGPRLGYVQDGTHLRPIYGIGGAAAVGNALDVGCDLALVAISPRQDYALATADNGKVLLVVPGNSAAHLDGVAAAPDRIAISPGGSAAALYYAATGHVQIVSGLPAAPALRDVDASFLNNLTALAVSDGGTWLAGVWEAGVYAFAADGSSMPLQVDPGVAALAFFAGRSDLALATPLRLFSVTDIGGNAQSSTLYDSSAQPTSPVGLGISTDNQSFLLADASGVIYAIDLSKGSLAIVECECVPEGVFPLSDRGFRLTGPQSGVVTMFDRGSQAVVVVPAGASAVAPSSPAAQVPPLSFGGLPSTSTFAQQLPITISIASPFATDLTGTATLTFQSGNGGDDQMIQFGSGGRTVSFTIAAGSTQASFGGKSSVAVLTGTVAGTITITATAGDAIATATVTTATAPPVIDSVTLTQGAGGFTVVITGYTPTREVATGAFSFTAGANATISQSDITVPLAAAFATWFGSTASNAFGGQFTLTMPFTVQGNASNVVRVGVDLTNKAGISNVAGSH
ncbi:MAG TPA: hypothetical protein VKU62_11060, partial [Thermoanaerobaculia bacterium]|nr:hypothetical protein [Thermoanaerobaculia bacterium]